MDQESSGAAIGVAARRRVAARWRRRDLAPELLDLSATRNAEVRDGKAFDLADAGHPRHEAGPERVKILADGGHRTGAGDRDGRDTGRERRCHETHTPVPWAVSRSAILMETGRPGDATVARMGLPDRRGGDVSARAGSASTRWNGARSRGGALLPRQDGSP